MKKHCSLLVKLSDPVPWGCHIQLPAPKGQPTAVNRRSKCSMLPLGLFAFEECSMTGLPPA